MNGPRYPYHEIPNNVLASMPEPLVSVHTTAYNHAPYIRKCIEGVLAQKTDFPFEFLIGEDCSTDGTREIVMEYAARYPGIIRVVTSDANVGSKENGFRCQALSRGKYVAFCEGDDYWTDPLKLKKQIEFLEKNPKFVGVGSDYAVSDASGRVVKDKGVDFGVLKKDDQGNYCIRNLQAPKTLTTVYRQIDIVSRQVFHFSEVKNGDWIYAQLMLRSGDIAVLPDVTGVYTMHPGGMYSSIGKIGQIQMNIESRERSIAVLRCLGVDVPGIERSCRRLHHFLMREYLKAGSWGLAFRYWRKNSSVLDTVDFLIYGASLLARKVARPILGNMRTSQKIG